MSVSTLDVELIRKWQKNPLAFIESIWGLVPQPLKFQYRDIVNDIACQEFTVDMFEPFVKGKHITWQQWVLIESVRRGLNGVGKKHIAIESGVGTGKSSALAMLLLWFLFCFKNAQVPCTGPTAPLLHDVLWKEVSLWLDRMPEFIRNKYELSTEYVRIVESPTTWYARARTGKKESPEALAGVHSDNVLALVDEASGVPDEVFVKAEGVLAGENVIVILISQHTRLVGYFHDSFYKHKDHWQTLSFDARQSPIVNADFERNIRERYGVDSDEYRVQVIGTSPNAESVDDKGYTPLLLSSDLRIVPFSKMAAYSRMGIDPSGQGTDTTEWVQRDRFKARVLLTEKISTPMSIAGKTLTVMTDNNIIQENVWVDNFGEGADVAYELAKSRKYVKPINVADPASDSERYLNKRAEAYWRLREWIKRGGELIGEGWEELLNVRYRVQEISGRIQIMPKEMMKKMGLKSPNKADALMLTFVEDDGIYSESQSATDDEPFNPHDAI